MKRDAYLVQETLHGTWYKEETDEWLTLEEATHWIDDQDAANDAMFQVMMGQNGRTKTPGVKVVRFDYEAPKPGEFD